MFPAIKQSLVVVTVEIIQNPVFTHGRLLSMKQKFAVEEKPFTSSLSIYPEACCLKEWGGWNNASPLAPPVFLNVYGAQGSIPRNEFRHPM
jgi:hypothetical protein